MESFKGLEEFCALKTAWVGIIMDIPILISLRERIRSQSSGIFKSLLSKNNNSIKKILITMFKVFIYYFKAYSRVARRLSAPGH